jgi:hypothetical protein
MVNTLQLKKQIERQKSINAGIKELKELSKEKQRLELEYNMLKNENKPKTNWSKIGTELKGIGNKIMETAHEARENLERKEKKQPGLGFF